MRKFCYIVDFLGLFLLTSCSTSGNISHFTSGVPDSALLTEVRMITREHGLVAAKERVISGLQQRDGSFGTLTKRVQRTTADPQLVLSDSLAALPLRRRERIALVIIPGTKVAGRHRPDRTRECLRGAATAAHEMGFSTWFVDTEARGEVDENAAKIASQVREAFLQADRVILVMLSKGAHDVIRYLQEDGLALPAAQRRKLVVALSLAGTVQGSVVADWMAHSSRPFPVITRQWLRISGQKPALDMLESISRSPWRGELPMRLDSGFPQLTWVGIAMVPNGADGRITERLWLPTVRREIERTAPWYSPNDGLVESAAEILPDSVKLPEWVVIGYGSHAMPNGSYSNGGRIAPQTTRPGVEKLRTESGGEIMSAYLRALPTSLLH